MVSRSKKIALLVPLVSLCVLAGLYFLFPSVAFDFLIAVERNIAGLEKNSVEVDGLHFEYLEGGTGEALVLLHGFGADKDNWTRIGRYLTPYFRVIAPDLPGFGDSTADLEADYTVSPQVERIRAFVRVLNLKAFHLGGSSMGGNIAGAYAAKYPGEVKMHLAQQAVERQPLNSMIFQQLVDSRNLSPLEILLSGLKVPALIVWGTGDRVLHPSGAAVLKGVMPEARAVLMSATGHLPMVERPKKTAELFLGFVSNHN